MRQIINGRMKMSFGSIEGWDRFSAARANVKCSKKEKKKKIEKNLFEMDFRWAADFNFSSVLLKNTQNRKKNEKSGKKRQLSLDKT